MKTSDLILLPDSKPSPNGKTTKFKQIMGQISYKKNYEEKLQTINELYNIKKYKVLSLSPCRVSQMYESLHKRVYTKVQKQQSQAWVSQQLKIFIWMIVCHLGKRIENPEQIEEQIWKTYSEIFNSKNTKLLEYQVKLLVSSHSQPRKWQKSEETLLHQILRPNKIKQKWNQASFKLYFLSDRKHFRNPKQIREHWLNHLNPKITKQAWSHEEDRNLINCIIQNGKRWALIAKISGNKRTQHMIKNRYYFLIRELQKQFPNIHDHDRLFQTARQNLEQRPDAKKQMRCTYLPFQHNGTGTFEDEYCFLSNETKKIQNQNDLQQSLCLSGQEQMSFKHDDQEEKGGQKFFQEIQLFELGNLENNEEIENINNLFI